MNSPVLHLLAGPNGAGKTTFVDRVLIPVTGLAFINADAIAARKWPGAETDHAYEAAAMAEEQRSRLLAAGASFISETVFSHPSKVDLVERAVAAGYFVALHVILVSEEVTVCRVEYRAAHGGHDVPEAKIRGRYARLWSHIAAARLVADRVRFYDNTVAARPFRLVAVYEHGIEVGESIWPKWTPGAAAVALIQAEGPPENSTCPHPAGIGDSSRRRSMGLSPMGGRRQSPSPASIVPPPHCRRSCPRCLAEDEREVGQHIDVPELVTKARRHARIRGRLEFSEPGGIPFHLVCECPWDVPDAPSHLSHEVDRQAPGSP